MIPYDHDYTGKRRSTHNMTIASAFDGELLWITMDGCHSWADGCYDHRWVLAMPTEAFSAIVDRATRAIDLHIYLRDVYPQLQEEIGDISFGEVER